MAILILIFLAGAIGMFAGIVTVILKNERTTNRHQLLSNIPGSVALGALICVLPGVAVNVLTGNGVLTVLAALISGFVVAWLLDALDH